MGEVGSGRPEAVYIAKAHVLLSRRLFAPSYPVLSRWKQATTVYEVCNDPLCFTICFISLTVLYEGTCLVE